MMLRNQKYKHKGKNPDKKIQKIEKQKKKSALKPWRADWGVVQNITPKKNINKKKFKSFLKIDFYTLHSNHFPSTTYHYTYHLEILLSTCVHVFTIASLCILWHNLCVINRRRSPFMFLSSIISTNHQMIDR